MKARGCAHAAKRDVVEALADAMFQKVRAGQQTQPHPQLQPVAGAQIGLEVAAADRSGVRHHITSPPATAIAWLANTLGAYGIPLLAGEIILSGSLAPLLPARAGDHFHLSLEGIGEAEVTFAA